MKSRTVLTCNIGTHLYPVCHSYSFLYIFSRGSCRSSSTRGKRVAESKRGYEPTSLGLVTSYIIVLIDHLSVKYRSYRLKKLICEDAVDSRYLFCLVLILIIYNHLTGLSWKLFLVINKVIVTLPSGFFF